MKLKLSALRGPIAVEYDLQRSIFDGLLCLGTGDLKLRATVDGFVPQ